MEGEEMFTAKYARQKPDGTMETIEEASARVVSARVEQIKKDWGAEDAAARTPDSELDPSELEDQPEEVQYNRFRDHWEQREEPSIGKMPDGRYYDLPPVPASPPPQSYCGTCGRSRNGERKRRSKARCRTFYRGFYNDTGEGTDKKTNIDFKGEPTRVSCRFISEVGPERLISVNSDRDYDRIDVWYWGD